VVIQTPSPFPYKSDKEVLWKYGINVLKNDSSERQDNEIIDIDKTIVDNISGIGGMTRSGCLFTLLELRNGKSLEKAKAFLKGKALQVDQELEWKDNKEIYDEAAGEFLRFIQKSE